jgi:hypothetical protein
MKKRTFELTIELIDDNSFDLSFLESESGESCTMHMKDSELFSDKQNKTIAREIASWVSLMRDEEEQKLT